MKTLKINVKVIALTALSFIILLSSCKEEESVPTEELLTAAQWNISELKVSSAFYNSDLFGDIPACNLDDLLEFSDGGVFQVLDEEDECAISEGGITASGSWTLEDNDKELRINSTYIADLLEEAADSESFPFETDEESWSFEIEDISSTVLRLKYTTTYTEPSTGFPIDVNLNVAFEAVGE